MKVYDSLDDAGKEKVSNLLKLFELGGELEAAIVQWIAERKADIQDNAAFEAAAEAAGYPEIGSDELPLEEWREYMDKRCAAARAALGSFRDPDLENWSEIHDRIWPISNAILAIKAPTLESFAIQVRAMTVSHAELWQDYREEDTCLRQFMRSACELVGVTPVELEAQAAAVIK